MKDNDQSLAQTLVTTNHRWKNQTFKDDGARMVQALLGTPGTQSKNEVLPVRQFGYDEKVAVLVEQTRHIPDKEILKYLFEIPLPSNEFWITGPAFNSWNMLQKGAEWKPEEGCRRGYLCRLLEDGKLSVELVTELPVPAVERMFRAAVPKEAQVDGRHIGGVDPLMVTRSGIESLFSEERRLKNYQQLPTASRSAEELNDRSKKAAKAHASFLARLIVLSGCLIDPESPWHIESDQEKAGRRDNMMENLRRRRMKAQPVVRIKPIMIDLTQVNLPRDVAEPKTVRELLGKTWVKPSRPWRHKETGELIRTREGRLITRRGHERKIAAPEDRRNTMRILTATRPASVDVSGEHPTLRVG